MRFLTSFIFLTALSSQAFSQDLVKSCTFKFDDDYAGFSTNTFEVRKIGNTYKGTMITEVAGQTTSMEDAVSIEDYKIRAGLTPEMIEDEEVGSKLNFGEGLIVHAMALTGDIDMGEEDAPEMNPFSAGLDLTKVRSVRVYKAVGEEGDIGAAAIIEAKDQSGKDLGSFMGGFLVLPCLK